MNKKQKTTVLEHCITARCLEERMAKLSKTEDAHFWLGGIGEEAFNVPLGMLAKKGHGLDYDFFHFHYRNSATMIAMGMDPKDELRQALNRITDPFSGGRNFVNHYARKAWNVMPVTSTIQTQCSIAPGSAMAQKRHGGEGITIVTFGDAGTAEGDFHVGLNWATQPGDRQLPLLFVCTNNAYGISTHYDEVHGQENLAQIAAGYGMETAVINGNSVEESWEALKKAFNYCRKKRRPYFLEARVSRLHGHSSSSGANRIPEGKEPDPVHDFRDQLIDEGLITAEDYDKKYQAMAKQIMEWVKEVKQEPAPTGENIYEHIFAEA